MFPMKKLLTKLGTYKLQRKAKQKKQQQQMKSYLNVNLDFTNDVMRNTAY